MQICVDLTFISFHFTVQNCFSDRLRIHLKTVGFWGSWATPRPCRNGEASEPGTSSVHSHRKSLFHSHMSDLVYNEFEQIASRDKWQSALWWYVDRLCFGEGEIYSYSFVCIRLWNGHMVGDWGSQWNSLVLLLIYKNVFLGVWKKTWPQKTVCWFLWLVTALISCSGCVICDILYCFLVSLLVKFEKSIKWK